MDLFTKMYYGTSMRNEKEAFDRAIRMLDRLDININSTQLDKYYSYPGISEIFETPDIIPKKNAKVGGSWKWKRELFYFVSDPLGHLKEYFRRNNSESGFSADKRRFGWIVRQKRDDRIDTALFPNHVLRNLLLAD
jgi:Transposase